MTDTTDIATKAARLARRPGFKAIGVALLTFAMIVPLGLVAFIVAERQARAHDATVEIGQAWGGLEQTVAGPFLVVPFDQRRIIRREKGDEEVFERRHAVFLPETLDLVGGLDTEERHRGIFRVRVYSADMLLRGQFAPAEMSRFVKPGDRVLWDAAFVSLAVTDTRGIRSDIALDWGGAAVPFEPGPGVGLVGPAGINAPLPAGGAAQGAPFELRLALKGSEGISFLPVGRTNRAGLKGDWPHPSFQGGFLPVDRAITDAGFRANWDVPSLAHGLPKAFLLGTPVPFHAAGFGVRLVDAVGFYQKVERSVKYAALFLGFTFLTFFLAETLSGARVHAVQYLMVGASQCIFYLLLLSAAEHLGFERAYGAAAGANIALITIYGALVLRSAALGLALFVVLLTVYGLLYSLLQAEDYALLLGSAASFAALAITMFLTRNVDWYGGPAAPENVRATRSP